jgi:NAD(P)-dependent dehydrogenase (short-subunit alcohol dehydrogenase family)
VLDFDNRVAIVTGAGRGLGRLYAKMLAERGARVLVNDLGVDADGTSADSGPAQSVCEEIAASGWTAAANNNDIVTQSDTIVEQALDLWGRVDILINNAGITGLAGQIYQIPLEHHDRILRINLDGTLRMTRAAWPSLAAAGGGRVVNISSEAVFGTGGCSHYTAAKAGTFGLTRALALEGNDCLIAVNAVMPNGDTRMSQGVPQRDFREWYTRHFSAELVAPFVTWLAHESATVNGEAFLVGGGRVARVFLGVAPGVILDNPTPEDYSGKVEELLSADGAAIPASAAENMVFTAETCGFNDIDKAYLDPSNWAKLGW